MTIIEFAQDTADYLSKKFPDVNVASIAEAAEYIAMRASNYTQDVLKEELNKSNEFWLKHTRRIEDLYYKCLMER